MKTITVRVLRRHITKGVRRDGRKCPIALALKERGCRDVTVYYGSSFCWGGRRRYLSELPNRVDTFIDRFDSGFPVRPFKFRLKFKR